MNKQLKTGKSATGETIVISRGIEWTDYTWNPIGGCEHDCEWVMPDGSVAHCYAKDVAERVASKAYSQGFRAHYWHPDRLKEPKGAPAGSKIFLDSMADLFGNWVPEEQIQQVLDVVHQCPDLHFQSLTKNAPRLLKFDLPPNLWVGVSAPPSRMFGKELTLDQQRSFVFKALDVLMEVRRRQAMSATFLRPRVTWMSIEPLSFDIADVFHHWQHSRGGSNRNLPLSWAVIGAASKGNRLFQPDATHAAHVHGILQQHGVTIFHKGNFQWSPRLEGWPV